MRRILLAILAFSPIISTAQYLQWSLSFGGSGIEIAEALEVDAQNNVIVSGEFSDTVDFDPSGGVVQKVSAGSYDAYIAKYDANGNFQWVVTFGAASLDMATGIALDDTGNVYVTGRFTGTVDFDPSGGVANLSSTPSNGIDMYVAKYDPNGNYVWAVNVGGSSGNTIGNDIVTLNGSIIYVTGITSGNVDMDPGSSTANLQSSGLNDAFILKLGSSGNYGWAVHINGPGEDAGTALAVDGSGNVYLTGNYSGTADFDPDNSSTVNITAAGNKDGFFAKFNANGEFQWARSIGGLGNDLPNDISLGANNDVYIVGTFESTADFDPSGGVANISAYGNDDAFAGHYSSTGTYIWAGRLGSSMDDGGIASTVDANNNFIATGFYQGTADMDPGSGTANHTAVEQRDAFIAIFDNSDNYSASYSLGGTMLDEIDDIKEGAAGEWLVAGRYFGNCNVDINGGTVQYSSSGSSDVFIAKYSSTPVNVETIESFGFAIYPNPVNNELYIRISQSHERCDIQLFDVLGNLIVSENLANINTQISINTSEFSNGVYLVRYASDEKMITEKLVVKH